MTVSANVSTGLYIYAFLNTRGLNLSMPGSITGIDGAAIQFQTVGNLALAMSPTESKKIRPQRKNLAAHQEVVTYLARHYDMLPVAFGLIADDVEQVERLLTSHREVLSEQIERVAGHVEMSVNLRWTVQNVVQHFVDRYSQLAAARNDLLSGAATRDDQIAVGQLLESLIHAERQQHSERFTDALGSLCKELESQPCREENDVMRLACLISRDSEEKFSAAVYKAASLFSDEFAISFNGPWPPYSFVSLALSLE